MIIEDNASERLIAQRVRNRIMETLLGLSEGDAEVRAYGASDWFEDFFDWFPYEGEPPRFPAMTDEEERAVRTVCKVMQLALTDRSIPKNLRVEHLIASGWPQAVAPLAQRALDLMMKRGRFSEEAEEDEPSTPIPWP